MFRRYAVYFVPDGAWGDFGAAWLGWDNRRGTEVDLIAPEHAAQTARPRKYGFHATIRSPFRPAEGCTQDQIADTVEAVCAQMRPIPLRSLQLSRIWSFLALTAPDEWAELQSLSDRTLEALDGFRAPLSREELARRRVGGLTDRQEELLSRWGYPHVREQFRFHLTLTGPLGSSEHVERNLREGLAGLMETPLAVDSLSLLGEAEDGRFQQIARLQF